MEEYRNRVINLHAIQSQNISKSTSDISKRTGKFTSETDRIRLGGGHGGATPSSEDLEEPWHWVHLEEPRHCETYETYERPRRLRREIDGYPFTTFDSFPTFLRAYCQV